MQTTSGKFQVSRFWLDVKKKEKTYRYKKKKTANPFFPFPFPFPKIADYFAHGSIDPTRPRIYKFPDIRIQQGAWQGCTVIQTKTEREAENASTREREREREREGERNSRCLATDPRHGVIHFGEVSLYAIYPLPPSPLLHTLPRCTPANSSLPCRCTRTIDAPDYWPTNVRGDLILNQSTAVSRLIYNQPWFESFVAPRVLQTPHAAALNENILIDCRITIAGFSLKIRGEGGEQG